MAGLWFIVLFNCVQPSGWMPKIRLVMNYNTASYIRSCVLALSVESGFPSVCAACRQRSDNVEEWEVALFSRLDVAADFFNYVLLAKAICGLAPSLTFYEGQYNSAVYGEEIHQAIIIW